MFSGRKESGLGKFVKAKLSAAITCIAVTGLSSGVLAEGSIAGRVVSEDTNIGLRGAFVSVEELDLVTKTVRNGMFDFSSVPAGEYTLSVDYLGGKKNSIQIVVEDDSTLKTKIEVAPDVDSTENVLVIGDVASFNKALNRQRSSSSIQSIVSADAIGQYPDANTSEALKRLPGVSIENDQGEGRWVRVRGMGQEFNSVTINGSKVTSPNGSNRAVALDVIPSDLLESLEVTKTLTPDMDADSLGGSINVQSLSAFDRDGTFYKLSAESSYDEHTANNSPKLSAAGSKKFALGGDEENFGIAAALSWFERDFGSDNMETGGTWIGGNALGEFEQRDYTITRERTGVSLNFDYKPSVNTDLYLRTLYSEYSDREARLVNTFKFANPLEQGAVSQISPQNINDESYDTFSRDLKDRSETSEITSVVLGGESRIDAWTIEYVFGHSDASQDTPLYVSGAAFEREFTEGGFSFRNTDIIELSGPAGYLSDGEFVGLEAELSEQITEDEENNFKMDLERALSFGEVAATIKFGAKFSEREKSSDENVLSYENQDLSLADIAGSPVAEDIASAVNDFTLNEDISAAYLMSTIQHDALFILFGARYENTEFSANGHSIAILENEMGEDTEAFSSNAFANEYSHVLPSIQVRYELNDKTQIRAAWTNSVVRPSFKQLSPAFVRERDEAEFGNPLLDPLTSSNIDIGIEHYMGFASVLSAFVFTKDIEDFVYEIDLGESAGINGVTEAMTYRNGEAASIRGLELAANKQFSELPAPWNGFFGSI